MRAMPPRGFSAGSCRPSPRHDLPVLKAGGQPRSRSARWKREAVQERERGKVLGKRALLKIDSAPAILIPAKLFVALPSSEGHDRRIEMRVARRGPQRVPAPSPRAVGLSRHAETWSPRLKACRHASHLLQSGVSDGRPPDDGGVMRRLHPLPWPPADHLTRRAAPCEQDPEQRRPCCWTGLSRARVPGRRPRLGRPSVVRRRCGSSPSSLLRGREIEIGVSGSTADCGGRRGSCPREQGDSATDPGPCSPEAPWAWGFERRTVVSLHLRRFP